MRTSQIFLIPCLGALALLVGPLPLSALAAKPVEAGIAHLGKESPDSELRRELTRVQIFLDRANFRPGKLDGLVGEFTQKAADRYCIAHDLPPGTRFDVSSIGEPYREYTVTAEDLRWIGPQAKQPSEQEKLKAMLYADAWELVAEKFHCDREFLRELNPKLPEENIAAGTVFRVPAVEEFKITDVVALEKTRRDEARARKAAAAAASASPGISPAPPPSPTPAPAPTHPKRHIVLLREPRIIELYEGDKLVACFPCTPGSKKTPVPVGNWHIIGNILMPTFRWDKSVLDSGVRSSTAFNLPPGPNNPVGIVWMGLNRPSVGMHGTPNPDQIGRNESHGCIRLANWDAFTLCQLVDTGTPVEVR